MELELAVAAWRAALGDAAVVTDPARVAAANRATMSGGGTIRAVLAPADRDGVRCCLRIAARFRIVVHPVSLGCNWGYGSRRPPRGTAVLLSLAGLDRVVRLDEAMGVVRVEPGVSFARLGQVLADRGSGLLAPWTGSGPHTSVLGNVLERGIGKGLYEDMAAHACGFEVVLADGGVLQTGPEDGSAVAGLGAHRAGPGLAGMFVQSNLGVVTAMDFRLHAAPALQQLLWARLDGAAALAACIDALRPVLQRGDPWLRAELVSAHRAGTQGSAAMASEDDWLVGITVWADGEAALACRRAEALAVLRQTGAEPGMGAPESGARGGMDEGWLRGDGLRGAYAAKPGGFPPDPDPDRDRCGVLWVAPVLPMRGAAVAEAVRAIGALLRLHGFGPATSLRRLDGRTLHAVTGLFFDRDEAGSDARAEAAAAAVGCWMREHRLAPYRLSAPEMAAPAQEASDRDGSARAALLRRIKDAADPAGILSPGRYIG